MRHAGGNERYIFTKDLLTGIPPLKDKGKNRG